ncbi:tektin-1 isoform X1 [Folsomia candida]|uniref:tektin-1 isoform X1 n=1 Tax=Folsomia candida TaxID=158441 RepID=UPI0016053B14|nr:tektin-1 isoform X1 [Folsomia candida]
MKTALRQAGYRRKSHFLHYHSTRFAYVYKVSTNGSTSYSRPNVIHGPKRYSAEEWSLAETMTHNAAESEQQSAEWVLAEAARLAEETREITDRAQEDIDWKFRQRFREMEHWRDEMKLNFGDLNSEIDAMSIYRRRLENALSTLCQIIQTNDEILKLRDCRIGVDLVNDEPQKQILQEMKMVEGIQSVLKRNMEVCTEQLRLIRKCAVVLGRQLRDKDTAIDVDRIAYNFDEHRASVQRQCEKLCIDDVSGNVTEQDWIDATEKSKLDAEKAVNASIQFRTTIDSILRQICEDLRREICLTNFTFERRLREVIQAKERMEFQHSAITVKVREIEGTICKLSKAFEERQSAVALAETRACIRGQRPNMEKIRDPLQRRLYLAIEDENEQMTRINRKIMEANVTIRNLQRNQLDLEEMINIKLKTIAIDEVQVIPLRKSINIQEY